MPRGELSRLLSKSTHFTCVWSSPPRSCLLMRSMVAFLSSLQASSKFALHWAIPISMQTCCYSPLLKNELKKFLPQSSLYIWFSDHHILSVFLSTLIIVRIQSLLLGHFLILWLLKCQRSARLGHWSSPLLHSQPWNSHLALKLSKPSICWQLSNLHFPATSLLKSILTYAADSPSSPNRCLIDVPNPAFCNWTQIFF